MRLISWIVLLARQAMNPSWAQESDKSLAPYPSGSNIAFHGLLLFKCEGLRLQLSGSGSELRETVDHLFDIRL